MQVVQTIFATNGRDWREREPDLACNWYAFSFLGTPQGGIQRGCQTEWTGFSKVRPFREERKASVVRPEVWRERMARIFELPLTVCDDQSLLVWLLLGGEALIESKFVARHYPAWLEPHECGKIAGQGGWTVTRGMPPSALRHAPTSKIRARVLIRDSRRCRLCGRSPDEDPHAFLEAHHGVPWGDSYSGLTVEENLFSVCKTCHDGISQGLEQQFLSTLGISEFSSLPNGKQTYFEGVAQYRRLIGESLKKVDREKGKKKGHV